MFFCPTTWKNTHTRFEEVYLSSGWAVTSPTDGSDFLTRLWVGHWCRGKDVQPEGIKAERRIFRKGSRQGGLKKKSKKTFGKKWFCTSPPSMALLCGQRVVCMWAGNQAARLIVRKTDKLWGRKREAVPRIIICSFIPHSDKVHSMLAPFIHLNPGGLFTLC